MATSQLFSIYRGGCGRSDPPVALEWSSSKIKVLGVFIGVGDLDVDNWRFRIDAVDHVLKSWRSRSLSFHGKALVINALAHPPVGDFAI